MAERKTNQNSTIDDGVRAFRETKNAVLLDVRTQEEYEEKHIEGSINIPIQFLDRIGVEVQDRSTPLYVYCHSGRRSARAATELRQMGYSDVTDIGGMTEYRFPENMGEDEEDRK